jgi:hypothetical protein
MTNSIAEQATTIFSLVSIALVWVFFFWVWRDYCVEDFRQKVFALRDELFDKAASGKIPYNHKGYGRLRLTMNGAIRFAEDISFGQVILMSYFNRNSPLLETYKNEFDKEIEGLPAKEKKVIISFQERLDDLLIEYFLTISPMMVFILIPMILIYLLLKSAYAWIKSKLVSWSKERFRTSLDEMQSLAYAVGSD